MTNLNMTLTHKEQTVDSAKGKKAIRTVFTLPSTVVKAITTPDKPKIRMVGTIKDGLVFEPCTDGNIPNNKNNSVKIARAPQISNWSHKIENPVKIPGRLENGKFIVDPFTPEDVKVLIENEKNSQVRSLFDEPNELNELNTIGQNVQQPIDTNYNPEELLNQEIQLNDGLKELVQSLKKYSTEKLGANEIGISITLKF